MKVVLFLIGAPLLNFVVKAFLYRIRKGRLRVVRGLSPGSSSGFVSDLGRFYLSASKGTLTVEWSDELASGSTTRHSFSELSAVRIRDSEKVSVVGEILFGIDLWDFFRQYRDVVRWKIVTIEKGDGSDLPVFVAGQYQRREFLQGWWFELEQNILGWLGLFEPVEDRAWRASNELQRLLVEVGALEPVVYRPAGARSA